MKVDYIKRAVCVLVAGGGIFWQAPALACEASPGKPTLSVTGAETGEGTNYYVVQIPEEGEKEVTITASGTTPCPTEEEKCVCPEGKKKDPEEDGTPKFTFTKGAGSQDPADGPTIKWKINKSTAATEYKFKVTKIEQKYKACPEGWTGGVASKSNTQTSDEVTVLAVKVNISGSWIVPESKDSGTYKVTVAPATPKPTAYKWLSGAPDAWPAAAGNNPELDYSKPTEASTIVKKTRWFAKTPDRRQKIDGTTCVYNINCEVTIKGVTLKDPKPDTMKVKVDMTGETARPIYEKWDTIVVKSKDLPAGGKEWYVDGIGSFARVAAKVTYIGALATGQFHGKTKAHEEKHVFQFNQDARYKDLWDAARVYNDKIKGLTSNVDEADLRKQIFAKVKADHDANNATLNGVTCTVLEKEGYDAGNAEDPDFLELDEADWKPLYGCP